MSKSDEQRVANGLDPDVRVVVVGATGAVGREALALLEARGHPREHVVAVASERSAGSRMPYGGGDLEVRSIAQLDELVQADVLVLLAVSADLARELAPRLAAVGARVVDNSSAFRSDPDVPLVVPEVNASALNSDARLVANPNCSTILMLVALEPLRRSFGVERVVISTYQAVSGAGQAAMDELRDQTRDVLEGKPAEPRVFPEPCAFNAFPHESTLDPATGMNEEERKLIRESRRVWADAEARIVPTCVRVPVLRTHCQSLLVTLAEPASEADVRTALATGEGLELLDDRVQGRFPTSLRAAQRDPIQVGRLRPAPDEPLDDRGRARSFCLWLAGDQLRKGAALNALQIGERLLEHVGTG